MTSDIGLYTLKLIKAYLKMCILSTLAAIKMPIHYDSKCQDIHAISTAQDTISQTAIRHNTLEGLAPAQGVTLPLSRGKRWCRGARCGLGPMWMGCLSNSGYEAFS
jgi:hypothetical protein